MQHWVELMQKVTGCRPFPFPSKEFKNLLVIIFSFWDLGNGLWNCLHGVRQRRGQRGVFLQIYLQVNMQRDARRLLGCRWNNSSYIRLFFVSLFLSLTGSGRLGFFGWMEGLLVSESKVRNKNKTINMRSRCTGIFKIFLMLGR
jgi:hypothetical protein